jgi:hypothetical protein
MRQSLMLFLSANRLHAQHMEGSQIVLQQDFTDTPDGRENFASFLQKVYCPTYLLTDLIEEDFRHEIVPHLTGGSRTALIKRKFDQFYRGTTFHQATLLQRQKTGRRDDSFLFSALTNPSLITPWLNILLSQQTPLAGIYSVPQISAPLVKNHPSNYLLLISWERFSGLRQTYFSEHHLQISRLTPVHTDMTFHDAVVNELARTYQYLKSLSLLPSGQTLDVVILCHANDRNELQDKLPDDVDVHYDFADIEKVSRQFKINYRFTDSDASQIFLHQLATRPPQTHYASKTHTHYFALWQLRRFLNLASRALFAGMILWSAGNLWQSSNNATEAASLKNQAQLTLNEVQNITHAFPNTYAPAADMKAGVITKHKLDQFAPQPHDILTPISATLDRHTQIELDDLSWKMDATEPVESNTLAEVPAQVITIKGHLANFANDYRTALNYLERFQQDLTTQGYKVTALTKPLDISPSGNITDQREARKNALDFSMKISRRPAI